MLQQTLKRSDFLGILAYCVVLYTLVLTAGGPLTMHEGVLSQTSRAMLADHDWVVPHFGEGPWLERPPLPQWITVAIATVVGHCNEEWVVRIGPALSGTITVMLTAWLGGVLLGRAVGILGALIVATMYQFVRYSTLAEADMFLAPIVASCVCLFAYLELVRPRTDSDSIHFVGARPWAMLAFFLMLGMTNLAKGVVFGTAMTLVPIGGYLLWNFNLRGILRYFWLWGWLAFAAVAVAWPIAAYIRYPDVLGLWHFDLFARLSGNYLSEPRWYYLVHWFWVVAPWPIMGVWGLVLATRSAVKEKNLAARLLWCWAFLTPLVFSYARSKHHHYMLHYLAPWGLLSSLAVIRLWEKAQTWPRTLRQPVLIGGISAAFAVLAATGLFFAGEKFTHPGPVWLTYFILGAIPVVFGMLWWLSFHQRGQVAIVGGFSTLLVLYWLGFTYKGHYLHRSNGDTAFLRAACSSVPEDQQLLVHAYEEALEGLRILFYCPRQTMLLHNMSHLRDDRLQSSSVFLLARGRDMPKLARYGQASIVMRQSTATRREENPGDRWALFHVQLRPDLTHQPARSISPMQAMYRATGPNFD